jgi:L-amino acid N-acyltransferase YncA
MFVEDKQTGEKFEAEIGKVEDKEFTSLKRNRRFDFDWSKYKGEEVYKLYIKDAKEILGLMRVIDHPEPGYDFLEIDPIEISKENQGKEKGLGRIGGCLLGFAAILSDEYRHDGFLVLVAKNKKASLFHDKYGFQYIGRMAVLGERMISTTGNSIELIKEFINKTISDET